MPSPSENDCWSEALDALAAAPEHHTLIFENEAVRVLETRIAPGSKTPIHTHRWPSAVYYLSRSSIVRRDDRGKITFDSRTISSPTQPSQTAWLPALGPHSIENVGDAELRVTSVELKD